MLCVPPTPSSARPLCLRPACRQSRATISKDLFDMPRSLTARVWNHEVLSKHPRLALAPTCQARTAILRTGPALPRRVPARGRDRGVHPIPPPLISTAKLQLYVKLVAPSALSAGIPAAGRPQWSLRPPPGPRFRSPGPLCGQAVEDLKGEEVRDIPRVGTAVRKESRNV